MAPVQEKNEISLQLKKDNQILKTLDLNLFIEEVEDGTMIKNGVHYNRVKIKCPEIEKELLNDPAFLEYAAGYYNENLNKEQDMCQNVSNREYFQSANCNIKCQFAVHKKDIN